MNRVLQNPVHDHWKAWKAFLNTQLDCYSTHNNWDAGSKAHLSSPSAIGGTRHKPNQYLDVNFPTKVCFSIITFAAWAAHRDLVSGAVRKVNAGSRNGTEKAGSKSVKCPQNTLWPFTECVFPLSHHLFPKSSQQCSQGLYGDKPWNNRAPHTVLLMALCTANWDHSFINYQRGSHCCLVPMNPKRFSGSKIPLWAWIPPQCLSAQTDKKKEGASVAQERRKCWGKSKEILADPTPLVCGAEFQSLPTTDTRQWVPNCER